MPKLQALKCLGLPKLWPQFCFSLIHMISRWLALAAVILDDSTALLTVSYDRMTTSEWLIDWGKDSIYCQQLYLVQGSDFRPHNVAIVDDRWIICTVTVFRKSRIFSRPLVVRVYTNTSTYRLGSMTNPTQYWIIWLIRDAVHWRELTTMEMIWKQNIIWVFDHLSYDFDIVRFVLSVFNNSPIGICSNTRWTIVRA